MFSVEGSEHQAVKSLNGSFFYVSLPTRKNKESLQKDPLVTAVMGTALPLHGMDPPPPTLTTSTSSFLVILNLKSGA